MGLAAFFKSTPWNWYPFKTFNGWPTQNLRDFTVLLISYVLLCVVKQKRRPFSYDVVVFSVTFVMWTASFLYAIYNPSNPGGIDWLSSIAVIAAIVFAVIGPVWKGDTRFIWQLAGAGAAPTATPPQQTQI